jgi:hypothetical protein
MRPIIFLTTLLFFFTGNIKSQGSVEKANQFISQLNESQKLNTLFPFDGEERYNYHFVPYERKGITFNEMNADQKTAAFDLLKTCLSEAAYNKTKEIMQLENVLIELEKRKPDDHFRDPGNYHISIFGIPSAKTIWGWRFEGHHISFNFSFDKKNLSSGTPAFLGTNPAIVLSGSKKGTQVLKDETDRGFALLNSLSKAQLQKTIIDTVAYKDILSFDKRNAMLGDPAGIKYRDLNKSQQALLLQLVSAYVHRFTTLFADKMLKEIQQAGLDKLWFAWAGHTKPELGNGNGSYYRIQGPTILIEYDNTQNNSNHIHSVLRDLKHDFGGDDLLEHYKNDHAGH